TLLIVPIIYSRLRKDQPSTMQMEEVPE
ncbi:MAG: hypothetical protein JWP98_1190, partial [Edaphobacter sp.]|nr:hypothetical protein [Edaphobacter sp.]